MGYLSLSGNYPGIRSFDPKCLYKDHLTELPLSFIPPVDPLRCMSITLTVCPERAFVCTDTNTLHPSTLTTPRVSGGWYGRSDSFPVKIDDVQSVLDAVDGFGGGV